MNRIFLSVVPPLRSFPSPGWETCDTLPLLSRCFHCYRCDKHTCRTRSGNHESTRGHFALCVNWQRSQPQLTRALICAHSCRCVGPCRYRHTGAPCCGHPSLLCCFLQLSGCQRYRNQTNTRWWSCHGCSIKAGFCNCNFFP